MQSGSHVCHKPKYVRAHGCSQRQCEQCAQPLRPSHSSRIPRQNLSKRNLCNRGEWTALTMTFCVKTPSDNTIAFLKIDLLLSLVMLQVGLCFDKPFTINGQADPVWLAFFDTVSLDLHRSDASLLLFPLVHQSFPILTVASTAHHIQSYRCTGAAVAMPQTRQRR